MQGSDLYKTTDGGATWIVVKKNIFSIYESGAIDLYFRNEKDGLASNVKIYRTSNGGIHMEKKSRH